MRLFFAIALDESVRAEAARVEEDLQRRLARAGSPRAVKWVERENLHVTLRFLGEIDESRSRALLDVLEKPLACERFSMVIGGAGAFPPDGAPRVVWIGVRDGVQQARALFAALDRRLASLKLDPEERAYTPHLTLGRVREMNRSHGQGLREWLGEVAPRLGTQRVDAITLYRSHLSSNGPQYVVLKEIPLS